MRIGLLITLLGLVGALVLGVASAAGGAGSAVIVLPPDCVAQGAGQDCSDAVTPFTVETADGAALSSVPDASGTIPWTFAAAANESIVYTEAVDAQPWSPTGPVWLVRSGGAPLELDSSPHDFDPSISYDGTKVTFAREDPATDASDIYTINTDGSHLHLVASGDGDDHLYLPKFSPDGGSVAYACTPAVNSLRTGLGCGPTAVGMYVSAGLMLMNSDGSDKRMIVVGELYPFKWLAWSNDGSQLAVTGCLTVTTDDTISCGHDQVFRYRTDGSDLFNLRLAANQITHESGPTYLDGPMYAQFTADGAQILFSAITNGPLNEWVLDSINADGSNRQQVATLPVRGIGRFAALPPSTGGGPPATVAVGQLPAPDGDVVITSLIAACSGYLVESAANAYTACVPGEAQPSFSYYGVAADHSVVFHAPENATDLGAPIWLDRPGKPSLELDSSPNDFDPSISPDGSKVTFARFSPSGTSSDIYTVHSDGSGLTLVASGHGMNLLGHPKFSPDGGSIAYACGPPGPHSASACGPLPGGGTSPSGLMLMNSDGTNPRMIVVFLGGPNGGYQLDVGAGQDFSWSPDGQRIATENEVNGSWQVFAYRTDGSDLFNELSPARQITHQLGLQGGYTDPQFSPTGTEIMYVRSSDGSGTLGNFSYVVKPDGTNTHEVFLTFDPADFQPGVFVPPALGGAPSATVRATQATVPPVGTLGLQAATRRLTGVKLTGTVAGRSYSSKVQRGAVLSQYPSARTRASLKTSKSRTVKLVISLGRLPATTKRR